MVTTRRGRNTVKAAAAPKQTKKQLAEAGTVSPTPAASKKSSKRAAAEAVPDVGTAADGASKKQKVNSTVVAENDLVTSATPAEAGNTTAAGDIPTGAGTAMDAEDVEPAAAGATAEVAAPPADAPAPTAEATAPTADATAPTAEATAPAAPTAGAAAPAELPVSEAVKHIGGTKAGESKVSEQPTAKKAIDSVPVGPDPAAAGTGSAAAADNDTDGDYFLEAALADSILPDADAPAHQVPASTGMTDATKTGFAAPPTAAGAGSGPVNTAQVSSAPVHTSSNGSGIAAAAGTEPADVPTGIGANKDALGSSGGQGLTSSTAAAHLPSSTSAAPTTAPTAASAHDSLLGGAAAQDSFDVAPIFGGDNA